MPDPGSGPVDANMEVDKDLTTPQEYALSLQSSTLFQESSPRSVSEQLLYQQWRYVCGRWEGTQNVILQLQSENIKLNSAVHELTQQFEVMKQELSSLRHQSGIPTSASNTASTREKSGDPVPKTKDREDPEYHTDEEELARETEWILNKHKRKTPSFKKVVLPDTETAPNPENRKQKDLKPPPIIVDGIVTYEKLYEPLAKAIENRFQVKLINESRAKINCVDADSYRAAVGVLNANSLSYHSYENKQTRPIRVMAKNLHHTCSSESIKTFLKGMGLKISSVESKISWKDKKPLNMFALTFDNDESTEKIYGITQILGCKVEIVSMKSSKLIPQCKNCQQFGHTKTYCKKAPRCVKCAGKHLTIDCDKAAEQQARCVNCGESHPANYRGCLVARELQNMKDARGQKPRIRRNSSPISHGTNEKKTAPVSDNNRQAQRTWASVVSSGRTTPNPGDKKESSDNNVLQLILNKLTKLEERVGGLEIQRKKNTNRR